MTTEKKRSVFWAIVLPLLYIAVLILSYSLGVTYSIASNIIAMIVIGPVGFLFSFINSYLILFLTIPGNILFWALVGYFILPKANNLVPKKFEKKNIIGCVVSWGIFAIFLVIFIIYLFSPSRDCAVNLKDNTRLYKGDRNVCVANQIQVVADAVHGKGIAFEAEVFSIADYDSFEYVLSIDNNQKVYYKDKNNVYLLEDNKVIILEDIDPATFDENYFEKINFIKPVITSPQENESVEGPIITIKGKATPGYRVVAYINFEEKGMKCPITGGITDGDGIADADGNFEFELNSACSEDIEVFVSAIEFDGFENTEWDDCIGEENLSESINFTIIGELHGICNM